MSAKVKVDSAAFYDSFKAEGAGLRGILRPLSVLSPRERAVFTEYHYWNTHMSTIAKSHRVSIGRVYEILYRAEEKVASSRAQEEKEGDTGPGKRRQ